MITEPSNEKFFSAASIWEVAIKLSLKKVDFDVDPHRLLRMARLDLKEVVVTSEAATRVAALLLHHRDPFDRLLVAQAIDAGARLLTADAALAAYAPHVLLTA